MGRLSSSCFKMITCASNTVNNVGLQTPPGYKASSGWREWVFKRRCPSHQMSSDTIIPEASSSAQDDYSRADTTVDEASIVVIQAAVRGYLAHRVLLKQKSIIKLQAAVRGHLVRRLAVGTLLCIQAIVKLQLLLRKRRSHLLKECPSASEKKNKNSRSKGEAKPIISHTSIDKLLSNKFAHRLLASAPRTKFINIKCEPSKSDTAWKWLVRWTSGINEEPKEWHEKGMYNGRSDGNGGILVPSYFQLEPFDEMFEDDDYLITYDVDNFDLQHACSSISLSSSFPNPYDVTGDKQYIPHPKVSSSDISDMSKFIELNSDAASAKRTSLLSDNMRFKISLDTVTFSSDLPVGSRDTGLGDASISNGSADQIVTSGCGTELSISSTLDSPDRPEGGLTDLQQELKTIDLADHPRSREVLRPEANGSSPVLGTESSNPRINGWSGHEWVASVSGEFVHLKKKLEADQSTVQVDKPSTGSRLSVTESRELLSRQASFRSKKNIGESASNHTSPILKDNETGKSRNSLDGSSGSNYIPSYMQATESTRAKIISNGSRRSIDKGMNMKDRGSPPVTNARYSSPRLHRSLSRAPHSPREGKRKR